MSKSYVLKAGGKDIYYRYWARENAQKEERLSGHIGKEAEAVVVLIVQVIGYAGGRFYVNEFRQKFTPRSVEQGMKYIYVGKIDDLDKWFPKPSVSVNS